MTDQQMSQDEFAMYIAQKIQTCSSQSRAPQLVALSGPDCAGKSTLAVNVQEQLDRLDLTMSVTLLSMDAFLIPRHLRTPKTPEFMEYFESAFDYPTLVETLKASRYLAPSVDSNSAAKDIPNIVLVEGVFLLRKELYQWWDLTVWLEVDTSVIMNRAIKRDKEYFGDERTVQHVYENRCLPAQDYHIRRDLPKQNADITAKFKEGLWTVHTSLATD
jgi:uridine kinase